MVEHVLNKIFSSNTYILKNNENQDCLIIDPGLDDLLIDNKLRELNLDPIGIISTHGHFDHIGSAAFFQDKYNIPFYLHEKDYKLSQSANFFLKIARVNHKITTPKPDTLIRGKSDVLKIGDFKLNVFNYSGHSEGGIVIEYKKMLFTGDIFYNRGLGFNGFPGENRSILRQSIIEIFDSFSNDHVVFPGHGDSGTLCSIKNSNSELLNFLNFNM